MSTSPKTPSKRLQRVPSKPPVGVTQSIHELVELAYELAAYTKTIEHGGQEHRQRAEQLIAEIQRAMDSRYDRYIYFLFESSIIPKLERLALEINRYRFLIGELRFNAYTGK